MKYHISFTYVTPPLYLVFGWCHGGKHQTFGVWKYPYDLPTLSNVAGIYRSQILLRHSKPI